MAIFKTANTTGKYYDDHARLDVLNYILDEEKTPHGFRYGLNVDMKSPVSVAEDMRRVAEYFGKDTGVRLRHFIISFAYNELRSLKKLSGIAWEVTCYLGQEYQVVSAVHEDSWNPNIHFVINSVNRITGERYSGTRREFIPFKQAVQDILQKYGIYDFRYVSTNCYDVG